MSNARFAFDNTGYFTAQRPKIPVPCRHQESKYSASQSQHLKHPVFFYCLEVFPQQLGKRPILQHHTNRNSFGCPIYRFRHVFFSSFSNNFSAMFLASTYNSQAFLCFFQWDTWHSLEIERIFFFSGTNFWISQDSRIQFDFDKYAQSAYGPPIQFALCKWSYPQCLSWQGIFHCDAKIIQNVKWFVPSAVPFLLATRAPFARQFSANNALRRLSDEVLQSLQIVCGGKPTDINDRMHVACKWWNRHKEDYFVCFFLGRARLNSWAAWGIMHASWSLLWKTSIRSPLLTWANHVIGVSVCKFFKPRAPPCARRSRMAFVSHHAVVLVVIRCCGRRSRDPTPNGKM